MPFSNTRETYITLVDLLNFLKVISEKISEFFLNVFVGISESSDAFAIPNFKNLFFGILRGNGFQRKLHI